jgi:Na+-translocating ferredoxin:NAD+ oxidoreductase RnfA subunit
MNISFNYAHWRLCLHLIFLRIIQYHVNEIILVQIFKDESKSTYRPTEIFIPKSITVACRCLIYYLVKRVDVTEQSSWTNRFVKLGFPKSGFATKHLLVVSLKAAYAFKRYCPPFLMNSVHSCFVLLKYRYRASVTIASDIQIVSTGDSKSFKRLGIP